MAFLTYINEFNEEEIMSANALKIGIPGAAGRMGTTLINEVTSSDGVKLVSATEDAGHQDIGKDAGNIAGIEPVDVVLQTDPDAMFSASDAVLDFTLPEATPKHLELAVKYKKVLIIGTTGFDNSLEELLTGASRQVPIVRAPNMSLCVNLLFKLTEQVSSYLDEDYDIEIFEMHHRHKIDSPSGTALGLGQAAAKGRNISLKDKMVSGRDGITGAREQGSIGFSSLRGGDIIGDHTVIFSADGERLELSHKSSSRKSYARGAVKAAIWAKDQPPGLYSMQDVINSMDKNKGI